MPRANANLKRLRIEAGLRQTDLADLALVARRVVQNAESGQNISADSLQLLAEALGVPQNFIQDEQSVDAIAQGPFEIHHYLQHDSRPEPTAFCATVDDAIWACTAMRDSWNEHIKRSQSEPGAESYEVGYQCLLQIDFASYRDRYVELWNANRNALMFASQKGERYGISVVLPVTDGAYERLRDGKIAFMDITERDVCDVSQNLVVDSCNEFSPKKRLPWYSITCALQFVLFYQMASMSRDALAKDFRMLGFGASPVNAKRLEANGFVPTGALMPRFEFPVYEFAVSMQGERAFQRSTVAHYVNEMKRVMDKNSIAHMGESTRFDE